MIRFTSNCRDGFSWFKGDKGEIVKLLVEKPKATSNIYLVNTKRSGLVWATSEDFEKWEQLDLF